MQSRPGHAAGVLGRRRGVVSPGRSRGRSRTVSPRSPDGACDRLADRPAGRDTWRGLSRACPKGRGGRKLRPSLSRVCRRRAGMTADVANRRRLRNRSVSQREVGHRIARRTRGRPSPLGTRSATDSQTFALVAQSDRASVFGPEGWGFESLRVHSEPQRLASLRLFSPGDVAGSVRVAGLSPGGGRSRFWLIGRSVRTPEEVPRSAADSVPRLVRPIPPPARSGDVKARTPARLAADGNPVRDVPRHSRFRP